MRHDPPPVSNGKASSPQLVLEAHWGTETGLLDFRSLSC